MKSFAPMFMKFTFIVLLQIMLMQFIGELSLFVCLNQRIENALVVSCMTGFYYYDLEHYASRTELSDRELREIHLEDNSIIRTAIRENIKYNLKLNAEYTPGENSFLEDVVEIEEINIYNPEDLPVTIGGKEYNITTIELLAKTTFKVPLLEKKIYTKRIIVNANTFLIESQKE